MARISFTETRKCFRVVSASQGFKINFEGSSLLIGKRHVSSHSSPNITSHSNYIRDSIETAKML